MNTYNVTYLMKNGQQKYTRLHYDDTGKVVGEEYPMNKNRVHRPVL